MQVKEIMTKNLEKIPVIASVMNAAEKMKDLNVGAIPVFKDNNIVGIVTDRDIAVRAVAENKDPADTPVMDIMSKDVLMCPENADIQDAAQMMEKNKVRRLIVTDSSGSPVGILSLGDIASKAEHEVKTGGEVLQEVSKPSSPQR